MLELSSGPNEPKFVLVGPNQSGSSIKHNDKRNFLKANAGSFYFDIQTMDSSSLDDLGLFDTEKFAGLGEEREPRYDGVDSPVTAPVASLGEEREPRYNGVGSSVTAPAASPPSRPLSPSFYDPLEWNIAQFSPVENDLFSSDRRKSHIRNESNVVNAVHMHVQDNARIPNYNYPVDRSNSSTSKNFPRANYTSDALFSSKIEQDNSMAEIFLSSESSYRKSLNQTYEISTEDSNIQKGIDELAAVSVDPTPWSEIKDKIDDEEERVKQQQHQVQLFRMAEALATAAAIARTNNSATKAVDKNAKILQGEGPKLSTTSRGKSSTIPSIPKVSQNKTQEDNSYTHQPGLTNVTLPKARSRSKVAQTHFDGGGKYGASNRHFQRQYANANPPPHAAAHAVSRASVLAATNQKSQYGFGGNHIIPSVPAPPSIRSSNQSVLCQRTVRKKNQTSKKIIVSSSIKPQIPVPRPPSTIPSERHPTLHVEINNGSAYERKKQKAKDARVKLNESIERLAIAVSLAGSQSKLRIDQLQNQIATTEFRQKSIAVNQEGIKLAESAKKWDRPSFVGTAASVIQSLNAQCEALMAELIGMQQTLDASRSSNYDNKATLEDSACVDATNDTKMSTPSTDVASIEVLKSISEQSESPTSNQAYKRYQQPVDIIKDFRSPSKRPRLVIKENLPSNDEVVFGSIAKMLDPVSLCRCACVTKLWRDMNAFKDEKHWLNLAVKRFGFYNVRKWSENLKDGECEEISNKHLYEEMNASNVMPHFSQEGLSFLGNGRIQGKLSGWVFIVERSNGETLRSVKRDPSSGASGTVGYQSRPVVELRIVIQNTGMATQPVILKSQKIGVDVSTRRRGGEFEEIYWDDRFKTGVRNMNRTTRTQLTKLSNNGSHEDICRLELFETAVIEVHINARGCSTISKFRQRSNFTKILASLDGTTVPMVIPFLKHSGIL